MMGDLISREMAIESIDELVSTMSVCVSTDECRGMNWMKQRAIKAIKSLPTTEKVGRWIYSTNSESILEEWTCNLCGAFSFAKTNFCHNCGADMRGEEDE